VPPQWILVADDDLLIRELWVDGLTRAGYRTLAAKTGHEAIDLMRVVVPHLAILDLRMPGLSGGEVLEYLHNSAVLRHVPVLIVSGFLEDEPSPVTTGLTIVGRLGKPLTVAKLVEAVRAALERPTPLDPTVPLG
jgi:CheY-like chemotaxis protein